MRRRDVRNRLPIIQDASGQPAPASERAQKPAWLKIRPPSGALYVEMKQRASRVPAGSMGRAVSARAAGEDRARWLGLVSGGQNWLVRLGDAGEVLTVPTLVHVPLTQSWFVGLANIRGNLFSVVDFSGFGGART